MQAEQHTFIMDELNKYTVCDINNKYVDKLQLISPPTVRNILQEKYNNGADMKAVVCLFDTLFMSSSEKRSSNGLYKLNKTINKWVAKMEKLPVRSAEGFVFTSDILTDDIKIIVKASRKFSITDGIYREYYVGISALNKLRYTIPTFVYTLGAYACPVSKTLQNIQKKITELEMYEYWSSEMKKQEAKKDKRLRYICK